MRRLLLVIVVLGCCLPRVRAADDFIFSVTEENDRFVIPGTDKHYTQGLNLALFWPDEQVPWAMKPLSWLPDFGISDAVHKYGIRVGQNIYTPADTATNVYLPNDRPYAGWLYAGLIRENRGRLANGIPTLDHFEIDVGVVGPWSQADTTQITFHDIIHVAEPNGWKYQLDNEPGLLILANRTVRLWQSGDDSELHAQLLAHGGIALGNVEDSIHLGPVIRVGYHIPDEFTKDSPLHYGWYLFGGINGRAVARNIFLDGNTFGPTPRVEKEPFVVEAQGGLVLLLWRTEISYTYHYINKEFSTQHKYDAYAAWNLTYRF